MKTILLIAIIAFAANAVHYEDPKDGCGSDEQSVKVNGI